MDYKMGKYYKNEILAEILFHNRTTQIQSVKLLCSRLLARHRLRENHEECNFLKHKFEFNSLDETDTVDDSHINEHNTNDKSLLKNYKQCPIDESNKENYSQQTVSSVEDKSLSIQEQFSHLSTNETQLNAKWYAYWEKNGEHFVNETWIKKYSSCTTDELPMDAEELYKIHYEQQYHVLYWKFVNEINLTSEKTEDNKYKNDENDECCSNSSEDYSDDLDCTSNFEFIYKYKRFEGLNQKLINAYRALSIIGHVYNNQHIFESAFVEYIKTNIVKSTRHLNIYRFPKMIKSNSYETDAKSFKTSLNPIDTSNCGDSEKVKHEYEPLLINSSSTTSSGNNVKSNVKNKKTLKKEILKQQRDKHINDELERHGYSYLKHNPNLMKYWKKRHLLFSEFEKGIQLDEESWYSVTPEIISSHIAERCSCFVIVDPFCGAGGNVIQFAKTCELVIAIDIDPKKIEIARHNAELYGVADRIQFIVGDFFALAPTLKADVVFLSPPWGGPELMNIKEYKLSNIMPENGGGEHLLSLARQITLDIAFYLPKNINIFDCINSADNGFVEVQQNVLNSRYNSVTVYYNELYGLCDENDEYHEL